MTTNTFHAQNPPLILIVDDDQAISALLKHLLKREGYSVKSLLDGLDAKDYILSQQVPPALVLLEMMLPSVNGYDLIEIIRGSASWKDIPVVVLSSLAQDDKIVRALKLGANDYVTKPFRVNELLTRISRLI